MLSLGAASRAHRNNGTDATNRSDQLDLVTCGVEDSAWLLGLKIGKARIGALSAPDTFPHLPILPALSIFLEASFFTSR